MTEDGARLGQSRATDIRLLLKGLPGAGEVAAMMVGHFQQQITEHLDSAEAQIASDVLIKVADDCVVTCDEAWERGMRVVRHRQLGRRRRGLG